MKTRLSITALVAAAFVLAGTLLAADDKAPALKCPVSGKPVNASAAKVDFNGGKVQFCCDNCPAEFSKNPDKYAAKANLQLAQSGQLKQTACPLTGKPVNPEASVDVAGVNVGLCCNNCKAKLEKASADERVNLVFKDTSKGFKPAQ